MKERMADTSVSIFGARGQMAKDLLVPLMRKHARVLCINRDSSADEIEEAWKADMVILSVPAAAVSDVIGERKLSPSTLVVEICSRKGDIDKTIRATGAAYLSLHPMNEPYIPWTKQKWLVIGDVPNHPMATMFLDAIKEKNVHIHPVSSAEEHDLLMSVTLGLPQAVNAFLHEFISNYQRLHPDADLSMENILRACSPGSASLLNAYAHTVCSIPAWLKEDLLMRTHPDLHPAVLRTFGELADPSHYRDAAALLRKHESVFADLKAPTNFASIMREKATADYDVMNELFLGRRTAGTSDLYVQMPGKAEEILPAGKRLKVGIHGISGAFTDEAWHRCATELLGCDESRYEITELVHAKNVLLAVERGEVDRGIFAFANSGSGGYIASVAAMGECRYELLMSFTMPINMCILAHSSVQSIHDIQAFYGHPIALSQCRITLAQRWPDIPTEACTDEMDTALSAKLLAQGDIPPSKAVFASKRAAALYGLTVLAEGVHHDPNNATAFAVIKRRES